MEVAAGDADQPEPVGPGSQPLALAVEKPGPSTSMARIPCRQVPEAVIPEVMGWMCQRGNAACSRIKAIAWPLSSRGLATQAGHPSPRKRAKTSRVLRTWRVRAR